MSIDQYNHNHNISDNEKENKDQDYIIYSKLTHHESQFNKGKKKYRLPEVDPNEPCYIHQLSVELITHIFSRLDPNSLSIAAKVCTYWRHVVMDDSCWRDAFMSYFGTLPLKRLSNESWKTEYIIRTHLLRKWKKGRGSIMTFNPKIGSLETMNVNFEESTMLVASSEHGVAAKCNPMTGKVSQRHLIFSTTENVRLPMSAVKMDDNSILWGSHAGYITLTTRTKTTSRLKVFSDFHHGPIRVLELPKSVQDIVLTGAEDGTVKVWDVFTTSCAWTFHPISASVKQPTCIKVTTDYRILIGYDDGSLVVWNCNLNHLAQIHRQQHQDDYAEKRDTMQQKMQQERIIISPPSIDTRTSVHCISYDSESKMVIVAYKGSTEIRKYNVNTGVCVGIFGYGHTAATSITCIKWDKEPTNSILTLDSAIKSQSINGKQKSSKVIDLSSPARSTSSSGQMTPSSSTKTTRLLVTGDDLGTVCIWNGDSVNQDNRCVKPIRILSGHVVGISAIFIDACKIITGSDDGWIRIWDPLTGENINTLGNKIPKNAPVDRSDVNVMRVKNIWCNDYQGVATIGHQVKTWDFSPGKQFLNRRTLKQKGKPCNNMMRDKLRYEIGKEVKESIEKLELEKEEKDRHEREINKLSLGGLSDQEMLDYAMMLSAQENSNPVPLSEAQSDFIDVEDEELMKAIIASLDLSQKQDGNLIDNDYQSFSDYGHDINLSSQIEDWPTVSESITESYGEDNEELDEELRYILELSKTDK